MSRYKHINELNSLDRVGLMAVYDDVLEKAVVELAATKTEDEIDHKLIKEEFYNILNTMDEVIDTETYVRYTPRK